MSTKIEQAFIKDFIAQAFGLPIAHENLNYSPTPGTAFVELRVFHNEILPEDLNTKDSITGLFQFILHYAEGGGDITAKQMRDTIFAAYPAGRRLAYLGQTVTIAGKDPFRAGPEDGWFKVIGRINYTADIPR